MEHSVLLVLLKFLLSLVALCSSALSKHYYIVPVNSADSACQDYQNGTCLTLEQLAQSDLTSAGGTNLTLSFLPGEHLLTQSLAIRNCTHIHLNGMNESMVSFHGRKRIEISHSNELHIKNIAFVQHTVYKPADYHEHLQGLDIIYSQTVYIVNCSIVGIDNQAPDDYDSIYRPSAIRMISNMNNVILDKFIARGNLGRVVYIESQCNVTILDSEFTGNQGKIESFKNSAYVVYIYTTNTVISDSKFHSNTGIVLMVDSATTFITQCDITNNIGQDKYKPLFSIVYITSHSSPGKLTDSSTSGCSVPSSYSVVTSDTAVHVGSKASMNSSLLPTKNKDSCIFIAECDFSEDCIFTKTSSTARTTVYHCTDISDVSAPDLRNVSNVNDIIYDFTTSNTSGSHGNRVRLCVNTHHQYTLPFINMVVFCDNETTVVIKEFETDTNQDNKTILTSERIGAAERIKSSQLSIGADNNKNNHTAVIITSCTFSNNTSQWFGAAILMYKVENVLITFCSFANNTSQSEGKALAMYKVENVLITFCSFANNTSQSEGEAMAMYEIENALVTFCSFTSTISMDTIKNVLITLCSFTNNTFQGKKGAIRMDSIENVFITICSFTSNTSQGEKGAILMNNIENVLITLCSFTNNTSQSNGGAIYMDNIGNVNITLCSFTNNTSQSNDGGAIYMGNIGNINITLCSFTNNTSQSNGGAIYMGNIGNVNITLCSFVNNTCSQGSGGAIYTDHIGNVVITLCSFTNSTSCHWDERAIYKSNSAIVFITSCSFTNNISHLRGGSIYISLESGYLIGNILITSCSFTNNYSKCTREGVWITKREQVRITESNVKLKIVSSEFKATTFHIMGINLATEVHSTFINSEIPPFYFEQSTVTFLSGNLFSNNNGSVYAFNSEVTFEGSNIFSNNYHLSPIYAVQSQIHFNSPEGITITNNTASLGGGIYLRESTMTVSHPIEISQNTADYGGGIYAYFSSIEFTSEEVNDHIMITNNNASQNGGGICAIASTIKVSRSHVIIDSNTASVNGGGMYLKQNSRVTLLKHIMEGNCLHRRPKVEFVLTLFKVILKISNNSAQFGGGIFVEDKTAGGSLCGGSATEITSSNHECFIQTIRLYEPYNIEYHFVDYFCVGTNLLNIFITNNTATISGDAIFGGLFDRCTVSLQAEAEMFASNGLDYISKIVAFENGIPPFGYNPLCDREWRSDHQMRQQETNTNCFYSVDWSKNTPHKLHALIFSELSYYTSEKHNSTNVCAHNNLLFSSVSSQPVRVMFCNNSVHMDQSTVLVKKGGPFKLHIFAMDQVGNPVNATIHSSVVTESRVGRLKEGQTEQTVGNQCTQLEYNVFSQDSSAQLELYADGPCTNLGISRKVINIIFLPCICAIGLQPSQSKVDCQCTCDPRLQPYQITNCSQKAETIKLETNIWIGVEENSTNGTGYIIHDCPFDYCVEKPVNISLNCSEERDRQCAFNRSGVLCGECQRGLSLVLATSRCKECSDTYLLLLIPFALAGIVLVVFILLFNITIATGTIHGLIFYANVLAANKAIFLPFTTTNFLTVFISWVNLDLGIETCFYSQLDSQTKVLLQLVFPAYLFLLIFLIIILSRYFILFAELLSNRNPVAALATLIVLSYSKLLRFIIAALQNTVLEYPDGSQERVWLYDANVQYFIPSHTPRFVAAAIILTAGGVFTVLLFLSQWLPRCSNWKLMKWTRNTKYTGFMDAYHAPFTPKHRYWVGLLLFALIVHNTVAAMATDTFLPVLSANSVSVGLIVLRVFSSRVYKDSAKECLEALFLVNLASFAAGVFYVRDNRYRIQIIANISMAVASTLFVTMISYHFYKYVLAKTSIWPKITDNLKNAIAGLRLRQAGNRREMYQLVVDNQMDNDELLMNEDELLEALDYNNEQPDIVDPPHTGGGEEEANTNQYYTPPNIVPATRPDQLREPDLDDLAPITTDDYRPAPHPPRPRANNPQGVTYTVIEPVAAV